MFGQTERQDHHHRILEGLRTPDAGTVRVLGVDTRAESQILRERTGMQLQQPTCRIACAFGKRWTLCLVLSPSGRLGKLLSQQGLEEKTYCPLLKLSGGQNQRRYRPWQLIPTHN